MLLQRNFLMDGRGLELDLDDAHVVIPSKNKVVLMSYVFYCAFEGSLRQRCYKILRIERRGMLIPTLKKRY